MAYADGTTFEAMGDGSHEDCSETIFKSIILRKGEYINKVLAYGVEQAWFNMLCIYTNQGRSLVAGVAEGGFLHEIPEGSIVLGFQDWSFHHHLRQFNLAYVELKDLGLTEDSLSEILSYDYELPVYSP